MVMYASLGLLVQLFIVSFVAEAEEAGPFCTALRADLPSCGSSLRFALEPQFPSKLFTFCLRIPRYQAKYSSSFSDGLLAYEGRENCASFAFA